MAKKEKGKNFDVCFSLLECPHCQKKITKEIKMATPASQTPDRLITCSECKKKILVRWSTDPNNGAFVVYFIKYPLGIIP